jgi:hypothetical protein
MKAIFLPALATVAIGMAAPALAADNFYLFGFSPSGSQTLTFNDITVDAPVQSGWFRNNGDHFAGNSNYLAALAPDEGYPESRNFFSFNVRPGVTTASVSLGNDPSSGFLSSTGAPITYTLYDVSSDIDTNLNYSGATGIAIFDDLGTGTVFGWATVTGPTSAVVVNFNAAGIAAINAAGDAGNPFTFGGRISVSNAVPEPASWAMLIAGFGLVGAAMRRRSAALAA